MFGPVIEWSYCFVATLCLHAHYFIFLQANLTFYFLVKQLILQLDLSSSWAFGVRWSPSGNTLAYVGQTYLPFGYLLESFFGIAYILIGIISIARLLAGMANFILNIISAY